MFSLDEANFQLLDLAASAVQYLVMVSWEKFEASFLQEYYYFQICQK